MAVTEAAKETFEKVEHALGVGEDEKPGELGLPRSYLRPNRNPRPTNC